ncbi:MAG: ATP-binding protein, partial [Treponema sp.]|nr:ATP-binding protein [Treponema sp.]
DSNFEELANYVTFRTKKSDDQDGGNALFAALEYWNGGFIYNDKRNGVAMLKQFQQKRHGVSV